MKNITPTIDEAIEDIFDSLEVLNSNVEFAHERIKEIKSEKQSNLYKEEDIVDWLDYFETNLERNLHLIETYKAQLEDLYLARRRQRILKKFTFWKK